MRTAETRDASRSLLGGRTAAAFLARYTKKRIGITMGIPTLRELFNEKYYTHLDGGILESFGDVRVKNDNVGAFQIPPMVLPANSMGEVVFGPHYVATSTYSTRLAGCGMTTPSSRRPSR